ncbi:MAG: FtsX-like permease family protein [Sedimentisphaerales bacterium]|nr:FtsX-like permease family protein [Sedimentisphaerales bacterium]
MYKLTLAIRYLLKRRIAYFAVLAVALCVFIVVVVMTVMIGLVSSFKQKNHDLVGDCVVGTKSLVGFPYYDEFVEILGKEDWVAGVSPVIRSYALVNPQGVDGVGVEIVGLDPVKHSRATGFAKSLRIHANDVARAFEPLQDANFPGCIFGSDVDLRLDTRGYSVNCFPLTAKGALAQLGTDVTNAKTFYYSDVSTSGIPKVDGFVVYLPFDMTQELCMDGAIKRASVIHIKFSLDVRLNTGCEKVAALWDDFKRRKADADQEHLLDTVRVQSWKEYRRASIAPMENEQIEMTAMFCFVAIVIVFIIFVVFHMVINHKSKDIGILKSIGVSSISVIELFSGFAFLVGLAGGSIGLFSALFFLKRINRIEDWLFTHFQWQLFDRSIFAIGDIPNQAEPKLLAIVFCSAIGVCLIGAFLPSWKAARQRPVETLQVNQV